MEFASNVLSIEVSGLKEAMQALVQKRPGKFTGT